MREQIPIADHAQVDHDDSDAVKEVAADVAYQRIGLANVVYCGFPGAGDRRWILIDAGVYGFAGRIRSAAEQRFGKDARPYAILLTHGHFDHVGSLDALLKRWDVPVFAHPAERPYLDGSRSYPEPDDRAGGLMSMLSPLLPRGPIDLGDRLRMVSRDGSIQGMPGWHWIHTPGHTPGHISLWRSSDGLLIAGDAVVTTRQESAYAALISQTPEMHGPPQYFTPDWPRAAESVRKLADLEPDIIVSGHGPALKGRLMRRALRQLSDRFYDVAVPESAERHAEFQGTARRGYL